MEGIGLVVSVIVAVYLAIDAPKQGKSPVLWAILGFIFGLLTLGIYFIKTGRTTIGWVLTIIIGIAYLIIIFLVISAILVMGSMFT
ncbi:hypothetical protein [Sediminibacillus massiliensis]|uniref:hypothetical protein n=1 Tax=Sediminibacillus massiliensis TaxID=1926277 RepID=UPI0009888461|nr:hypothetical protein [Sediminibacillus massiliensis]